MKNIVKITMAVFMIVFISSAIFSDGGIETGMSLVLEGQNSVTGMKVSGGFFTITRNYTDVGKGIAAVKKEFIKMKVDVPYEIKLVDKSDNTEKIISTKKSSIILKPGVESVKIVVDKEVKEVLAKIKKQGFVSINITLSSTGGIGCGSPYNELQLYNAEYQKSMIDNASSNTDKMQKFMEDYQKYMMQNAGKDPQTLNKEFYKKYPQYKGLMPAE